MKHVKLLATICAASALSACASMSAEELRPKLAKANVEVTVKTTIKEIPFFTRSQEIGQGVAMSAGIAGVVAGIAIAEAGRVAPVPINEGFSGAVANEIKGRLTKTLPGATENYRLEVTDGAVFRTTDAHGSYYALNYAVGLTAIDKSDNKKLTMLTCFGSGQDHLPEEAWRRAGELINVIRKQAITQCSKEFIDKLADANAPVQSARSKKKK